jgi:predicted DNA-binding protein YlxM (UPF0122 family)
MFFNGEMCMEEKHSLICGLLDYYAAILSPRQREVLELYYYEDLSLAEIAENLGITRQGVRDTVKHGEEALEGFENALGLMKKSKLITESAEKIAKLTEDEHIRELARNILEVL